MDGVERGERRRKGVTKREEKMGFEEDKIKLKKGRMVDGNK